MRSLSRDRIRCAAGSTLFLLSAAAYGFGLRPVAIDFERPFDASGSVVKTAGKGPAGEEIGVVNGVRYRIDRSDGRAVFSALPDGSLAPGTVHWSVACGHEAGMPVVRCDLKRLGLVVRVTSREPPIVWIEPTAAGSTIQVDHGRPVQTQPSRPGALSAGDSAKVLRQLRLGTRVVVRMPSSGEPSESAFELHGFNEALRYLNWALSRAR